MRTHRLLVLAAVVFAGCNLGKLLEPGDKVAPVGSAAASLVFTTQPADARAGAPIVVRVTARDSAGRRVEQYDSLVTVALDANPGGATLCGTQGGATVCGTVQVRAAGGVALFPDLTLDKAGSGYTLGASSADLPTAPSRTFAIAPSTPTQLTFTVQPRDAMADSAIRPPVQVSAADSFGNAATDFTGTVRVRLGNDGSVTQPAQLSGILAVQASGGVATFANLKVDKLGTGYTLKAGFGSASPVGESDPFNVAPGAPPPPTTGALTASTNTTGADQDPDGYTVTVDQSASQAIGRASDVTFPGLTPGDHSVKLDGVASNCAVSGANPRTVTVTAGDTAQTSFAVSCTALPPPPTNQPPLVNAGPDATLLIGGLLTYTLNATFTDPDHDGPWNYTIDWGDGPPPTSGVRPTESSITGSHTYPLLPGTYTVRVTVVDSHGNVGSDELVVDVRL